jgi:hypothetical protein
MSRAGTRACVRASNGLLSVSSQLTASPAGRTFRRKPASQKGVADWERITELGR